MRDVFGQYLFLFWFLFLALGIILVAVLGVLTVIRENKRDKRQ